MNAKKADKIATGILYAVSGVIVLILAALLIYILARGIPHISWEFLTQPSRAYQVGGGIGIQLFNSLYLLLITMIISIPISLGAGIYLSEYAKKNWLTDLIRTSIEILSSLPSVVVGLFGFLIFVVQIGYGFSILSGALALTFFNLPLLTRNVEESLKAIHYTQREAGLALGLSRWETVKKVILPEALPGILTGVILSSGRIFGEAAALIYTAGQSAPALDFSNWNPLSVSSPISIFRQAETLAVHIWKINTEGTMPDGGDNEAIKGVDLQFEKNKITALIGPSGCGKSTYLRSLNRMNDGIANSRVTGKIMYKDVDVNTKEVDVYEMRKRIGMVFQRPNPFSKSIYENITFALKQHGEKDKKKLDEIVETSLKQAALWDQVKDNLNKSALALSGGQQQRLCIARAIAMKPDILLLDEPASALDPISTGTVEETLVNLKDDYTIIIVTHNMQQAARISDYTAFFYMGKVIEYDHTRKIFTRPKIQATEDYVSGHFG